MFRHIGQQPRSFETLEQRYLLASHLVRDINIDDNTWLCERWTQAACPDVETLGEQVVFARWTEDLGSELWSINADGSEETLVKDIRPGGGGSRPESFVRLGDRIFFLATNDQGIKELWSTDGSKEGTIRYELNFPNTTVVQDIDTAFADVSQLYKAGDRIAFVVENETEWELWTTDGEQTSKTLSLSQDRNPFLVPGDQEVFAGQSTVSWVIGDPSARLKFVVSPNELKWTSSGGRRFFYATYDGQTGLWTQEAKSSNVNFVTETPRIESMEFVREQLFFSTRTEGQAGGLWVSDGTAAGTRSLHEFPNVPTNLTAGGDTLFFTADEPEHGAELWKSDGTDAGTILVKDIYPGGDETLDMFSNRASSEPNSLLYHDGFVYFAAGVRHLIKSDFSFLEQELWRSDGTDAGTTLVADWTGERAFAPVPLTATPSRVLFIGEGERGGIRLLYSTDGSPDSTTTLTQDNAELARSTRGRQDISGGIVLGDSLVFNYTEILDDRRGIWISDGSKAGTIQLTSNVLLGSTTAATTDAIFFQYDGTLWSSDGTPDGTKPFMDATEAGRIRDIGVLGSANDLVYFLAERESDRRWELWRTDGSDSGTVRLAELPNQNVPLRTSRHLTSLLEFNDRAIIEMPDEDLWFSDGTEDGTWLLPESVDVTRTRISKFQRNGELIFALHTEDDVQIWGTDGTRGGTQKLEETDPLSGFTDIPYRWTQVGDRLVVAGQIDNNSTEFQAWSLHVTNNDSPRLIASTRYPIQWILSVRGSAYLYESSNPSTGRLFRLGDRKGGVNIELPDGSPRLATNDDELVVQLTSFGNGKESTSYYYVNASDQLDEVAAEIVEHLFDGVAVGERTFFTKDDGVHGEELWIHEPDPEPLLADLDNDGVVGFSDFLILSTNFGKTDAVRTDGDLNDDRMVTFEDFLLLSADFGRRN